MLFDRDTARGQPMRLCFVQFGDMKETLERHKAGLAETYRAQDYSVDFVINTAARLENCSVIAVNVDGDYSTSGAGLDLYGLKYYSDNGRARLRSCLKACRPTHIILRSPILAVLDYAKRHNVEVFPLFADSFNATGWSLRGIKARLRTRKLVRALNDPAIKVVSNHNTAACKDLVRIGVHQDKILPWDWPSREEPSDHAPKDLPVGRRFRMLYVGSVVETKGVGDIVRAFAKSRWLGDNCTLDVYGAGDALNQLKGEAADSPSAEHIVFHGRQPNGVVMEAMRDADLVLVPSWHAYPEGLPGTIYEALTVRTPIMMTDHPMFAAYFLEGQGAVFFPERSAAAFAACAERVLTDRSIYRQLSERTADAFERIRCPNLWHEVVGAWVDGDPQDYLKERLGKW